jgi:hypothetical protein
LPTLFAAVPTLLAPLAAVSLTVSPTVPTVLCPFRDVERLLAERPVDRARELPDDDRPRDEDDRARVVELRELELREPDAFFEPDDLRELDAFVVLPLFAPFREVLLERLEVLPRRLVLAFACAIFFHFLRFESSPAPEIPFRLFRLTRASSLKTEGAAVYVLR